MVDILSASGSLAASPLSSQEESGATRRESSADRLRVVISCGTTLHVVVYCSRTLGVVISLGAMFHIVAFCRAALADRLETIDLLDFTSYTARRVRVTVPKFCRVGLAPRLARRRLWGVYLGLAPRCLGVACGSSSVGRALASQAGCRGSESRLPLLIKPVDSTCQRAFCFDRAGRASTYGDGCDVGGFPPVAGRLVQN